MPLTRQAFSAALLGLLAVARASAQCPDGTPPPCVRVAHATSAPAANSVAVLYFANTSRDTADDYLADGLTEEIILRLQQVPRLVVKSRYESQRVRARRGAAPAALGRELGARYLVNGTIQRAGDRLVVRVELTRAEQGVGVWSERFDRTSGSVLDVIDDVARGVASGVAGQLFPSEVAGLTRRPTVDPAAYEAFVRGNVYLAQRSRASLARAVTQYEAAFARDPQLKVALARIAYVYALGSALDVGELSRDTVLARAAASGERAMRLAPDVPDTWIAAGFLRLIRTLLGLDDDIPGAVASLAHAVELDPRSAEAHHQYGQGLAVLGADSAALAEYSRALELEPGRAVSFEERARVDMLMGRPAASRDDADSAVATDPQFVRGLLWRARARLALGDVSGAERDVATATPLAQGFAAGEATMLRVLVLAARGDSAQARAVALGVNMPHYSMFSGEMLVAAGEPERALAQIADMRSTIYRCYLLRFPMVAALHGRPDFDRLAATCPAR